MNSYELSRMFWDWSFENPEKVKPIHSAIYFFAIEHNNRLGWKKHFGFPAQMVMDALGIKNGRTYRKALDELEDFGFIQFIERSKNQYSANIIALSKNTQALDKALDKAMIKHNAKQGTKQVLSIAPIDKQINKEQINKETINGFEFDYKIELTNYIEYLNKDHNRDIGHMQVEQMIKMLDSWYKTKNQKVLCLAANISGKWKTLNFVDIKINSKKAKTPF